MKTVFYLKTCDSCKKLMNKLELSEFELREIKSEPISVNELEKMYLLTGSYEVLFSKRAKKYSEWKLKEENLKEEDFKRYLLEEYTFLNRPVMIDNDRIFVGKSKNTVEELVENYAK